MMNENGDDDDDDDPPCHDDYRRSIHCNSAEETDGRRRLRLQCR